VTERSSHVAQAVWWCGLSVGWAAIAGATSLIAGLVAGSIALIGFGADSLVDGSASAVLVWRFSAEISDASQAERVERQAARAVGVILMLIGLYLTVAAVLALANRSSPETSVVGVALSAASVLVLPILAQAKLRLGVAWGWRAEFGWRRIGCGNPAQPPGQFGLRVVVG
jgi:divalent metal cation (Fe/Co/Zn/Cd) transporter